jgi:hypothetical protein
MRRAGHAFEVLDSAGQAIEWLKHQGVVQSGIRVQ